MSKKKVDQPIPIGKDEMNLVEFPITLLSKRHDSSSKTLEFCDTITGEDGRLIKREWIVTGSDKYGLPLAVDNDVLLALLIMGKENNFATETIGFSRYRLIKIMKWEDKGQNYKRIEESLDRLKGVSIKAKNAFWDNERKCYHTVNFGIIDGYDIIDSYRNKSRNQEQFPFSSVELNKYIYQSIKAGYIKSIDTNLYFSLNSAISKRLYRYLDKKRYDGKKKFEINLYALAYVHLGFDDETYKYASLIKSKLDPVHQELIETGFLKAAEYQKTADGSSEKLIYTFGKKAELPEGFLAKIVEEEAPKGPDRDTGEAILLKLMEYGITRKVAEQISGEYPTELIEKQIGALAYRKADDLAAVLISSIQGDWTFPAKYQEQVKKGKEQGEEEQARVQEEHEKTERRAKIEKYLSSLTRDENTELTAEARELAREEGGAFFNGREIPQYMVSAYVHMVVEKRLGL